MFFLLATQPTTSVALDRGSERTTSPGLPPPATLTKSKLLHFSFLLRPVILAVKTTITKRNSSQSHPRAIESTRGSVEGEKCTLVPPTRFRLPIPSPKDGQALVVSDNRPIALFPVHSSNPFFLLDPEGRSRTFKVALGVLSCSPKCCHGHRRGGCTFPRVSQSCFPMHLAPPGVNSTTTPLARLAFTCPGDCCLCNQPSSTALFAHASSQRMAIVWHRHGPTIPSTVGVGPVSCSPVWFPFQFPSLATDGLEFTSMSS
jgi:hypothetical protein